jgi:hypothetical protein
MDLTLNDWSNIFQILNTLGTVSIAIIVYVVTKRAYQAQALTSLMTTINSFNELALTNDKCLMTFHRLATGEEISELDAARESWAIFSLLNNRQLHYFLSMTKHSRREYFGSDAQIVANMLKNPRTKELLLKGGYDPDFVKYCLSCEARNAAT